MADQGRVEIRVVPDTRDFTRKLKLFLQKVEQTETLNIKTDLDASGLHKRLGRILKDADTTLKLKVDDKGQPALDRAERSIKKISVASKNAEGSIGKLFAALGGTAQARGVGIVALGIAAASAAPAVARLVAALAPAAGLIVALPAAAVGAAAAIGVLHIALSGVSDTLGAGLTGDTEKFNEGLKKLSPSARTFAKEVVRLRPQLDALRKSVQEKFFVGFTEEFRNLATRIMPVLNQQLTRIAASLGGFAENFARAAQETVFVEGLRSVLAATADSLAVLNNAVGPLTDAFGRLFAVASPLLTQIATSVSSSLKDFAALVKRLDESGRLATILANAVTTISQVFQILKNVGVVLLTVFQGLAAGGGGLLGTLVGLTGGIRDLVTSAEGAAAIKSLASALGTVGTIVRSLISSLGPGLAALLVGLSNGLSFLAPIASFVGTAISDIAVAVAPLLPLIGRLLAAALVPLATVLAGLVKAIAPFVTAVADVLVSALEQLLPAITEIATFLLPFLAQGFQTLTGLITPLIPLITTLAKEFATGFVKGIKDLKPVLDQILPGLQQLGSVLLPVMTQALTALIPAMQILGRVFGIVVGIAAIVINAFLLVGLVLTGLVNIVKQAGASIKATWNSVRSVSAVVWNAVASVVSGAVKRVIATVRGIPGAVSGIFGGAGGWLVNAGRQIIEGLIRGIKSSINKLKSVLGGVTSLIPKVKGPASVDKKLLTPNGRMIMDGLNAGLNEGALETRRLLQRLTGSIGDTQIGVGGAALASAGPSVVVAKFGNKELYGLVEDAVNDRPERFAVAVNRGQSSVRNRGGRI